MRFPAARQLALQGAAVLLVLSVAWPYYVWHGRALPWLEITLAIGAVAALIAALSRQPWWWCLIHALFMPLAWALHRLAIDPLWFLGGFMLLLLVYRGALIGQVPLYLSNQPTVQALGDFIEENFADRALSLAELGAGIGSLAVPLTDRFPHLHCTAVENAPLTWLVGRLSSLGRPGLAWRWEDFWQLDLASFDVVYAFLSPTPMPDLWQKACHEMRPGSWFVSNSFAVPDVPPTRIIDTPEQGRRILYCYRLPGHP